MKHAPYSTEFVHTHTHTHTHIHTHTHTHTHALTFAGVVVLPHLVARLTLTLVAPVSVDAILIAGIFPALTLIHIWTIGT